MIMASVRRVSCETRRNSDDRRGKSEVLKDRGSRLADFKCRRVKDEEMRGIEGDRKNEYDGNI